MYQYDWDAETGGLLLTTEQAKFSKEPRPVYYKELDILGFDQFWQYPKDDSAPLMWAEANNYIYRGRLVAKTKGGSLYTKPAIVLLEEPEPDGTMLKFVDVENMCRKNYALMETLVQETIQNIYNTYRKYKKRINIFYVAFSGGKDSVIVFDLVQRALPHDSFKVLFGNTDMEFPTTIDMVRHIAVECKSRNIEFIEAKAEFSAENSWNQFGPPARRNRWCCTVHKTAPIVNRLCEIYGLEKLKAMMMTGVRRDESAARSDYDTLSIGKKLSGQYSFHPILEWSSAEVFLYTYQYNLMLNKAYMYGFNRVGCIMCPNSSDKHEYIKNQFFLHDVTKYCAIITGTSRKDLSGGNAKRFLEEGSWKTRLSGRELIFSEEERFSFEERKNSLVFNVTGLKSEWKTWYKTIGQLGGTEPDFLLEFNGVWRKCHITHDGNITIFEIENEGRSKNSIEFIYLFKCLLAKSQYCIQCKACVAECAMRHIKMDNGKLLISDNCTRCHACLKILSGCLYYHSIRGSKDMKSMKGINRYLSVGVDANWIKMYAENHTFEPGNRKTDVMFGFMTDALMTSKRKLTSFGEKVINLGLDKDETWALLLCNLVCTSAFGWYVENIPFYVPYTEEQLSLDLADVAKKARGEFWNGFKVILDTNRAFQNIGFGKPEIEQKINKNGEIRKKLISITRSKWYDPVPEIILYSLYKFAEACGNYYQFSLETLLDDSIQRDGVSPTRIFGLDHDTMIRILNGLSINYPEFISASFTLDLDNITLREDKKAEDVLHLL
ncbi:MAG: phosphoadenosine phosphosulfate reductase family protein [Eubacterium sp.]|nr:phosphoadenosine phosphosulfate reductase family protein [Eubacterium sp.]